jgi:hypothetical protein
LKRIRRILIALVIVIAAIFVGVNWIIPVGLSSYMQKKAPPVTRVVPIELKDERVSTAPGKKLSYFGYEFEVPWSDIDAAQTQLYPKYKSTKNMVDLRFRSGLRMLASSSPPIYG